MPNAVSQLDRRALLTGAAAAAGIAALSSPLRAARVSLQLATGSLQDWSTVVGTTFSAMTEMGVMSLRLVAVEALPTDPARPADLARKAPFLAIFAAPANLTPSGDRIYRLSAPGIRTFDVYFSAAGNDLRAVFN